MSFEVNDFDNLHVGVISIDVFGKISRSYHLKRLPFMKKRAYYDCKMRDSAYSTLYRADRNYRSNKISASDKLYVFPDCRISRDIYRKSGYSLTNDPDKADMFVYPQLPSKAYSFPFDLLVEVDKADGCKVCKDIILFTICTPNNMRLTQDMFDDVKDSVNRYLPGARPVHQATFPINRNRKYECLVIRPYDSWREIILMEHPERSRKYISELDVPTDNLYDICPETLDMWSRSNNFAIVAKQMLNSNWKEYPLTVSAFLCNEGYGCKVAEEGGRNMRLMIEELGVKRCRLPSDLSYYYRGRIVQPKDYQMLQQWILYKNGVGPKGGHVFNKPIAYKNLIRHCETIAPVNANEPMTFDQFSQLCSI